MNAAHNMQATYQEQIPAQYHTQMQPAPIQQYPTAIDTVSEQLTRL